MKNTILIGISVIAAIALIGGITVLDSDTLSPVLVCAGALMWLGSFGKANDWFKERR